VSIPQGAVSGDGARRETAKTNLLTAVALSCYIQKRRRRAIGRGKTGDGSLKTEAAQPMRPMVSDKRFMAAG